MKLNNRFDNDYSSCSRTYATLCIYHPSGNPEEISSALQLKPDSSQTAGELIPIGGSIATTSGWFLGTKGKCKSKDHRAHVEWILDKITPRKTELQSLHDSGYKIKILCFWESASGNGGPTLDHSHIKRLAEFPVDLDFDIWFDISG